MANPKKRFSVKRLAGDATGGAVHGAITGGLTGAFDPSGSTSAVLATTGFVVGFVGSAFSHVWGYATDDPFGEISGRSAALFTSVVGLFISAVLCALLLSAGPNAYDLRSIVIFAVGVSSLLGPSLQFLAQDRASRRASDQLYR